jgi:hypothetical protein
MCRTLIAFGRVCRPALRHAGCRRRSGGFRADGRVPAGRMPVGRLRAGGGVPGLHADGTGRRSVAPARPPAGTSSAVAPATAGETVLARGSAQSQGIKDHSPRVGGKAVIAPWRRTGWGRMRLSACRSRRPSIDAVHEQRSFAMYQTHKLHQATPDVKSAACHGTYGEGKLSRFPPYGTHLARRHPRSAYALPPERSHGSDTRCLPIDGLRKVRVGLWKRFRSHIRRRRLPATGDLAAGWRRDRTQVTPEATPAAPGTEGAAPRPVTWRPDCGWTTPAPLRGQATRSPRTG